LNVTGDSGSIMWPTVIGPVIVASSGYRGLSTVVTLFGMVDPDEVFAVPQADAITARAMIETKTLTRRGRFTGYPMTSQATSSSPVEAAVR